MMAGTHGNHQFVCNPTWVPAGAGMTEVGHDGSWA